MPFSASVSSTPVIYFLGSSPSSKTANRNPTNKQTQKQKLKNKVTHGAAQSIGEVISNDVEFIKKGIGRGLKWANEAFRVPQISKSINDVVWLRHLEDPRVANDLQAPSWPQPRYPELSGIDLFMADVKALEAYVGYFYWVFMMWRKPLPEIYDPQEVANYFSLRPHVVALRLIEVFTAFAAAATRIRMSGILISTSKNVDKEISQYNFGVVLKETMLNLGPTFIKVGQSLSTRPDIIGSEISKALSQLHDQVPPFPRGMARKIIEEELGSPVETLFRFVSEEPVAAASFGQVYRGSTLDGLDVAIKVQRPDLRHVVVRDIYILRLGLGVLQKIANRKSDLRLYADELGKGFVGELDYTLEAANASEFMEAHSAFHFICVPKVLQHLSRKKVLTMEWMVGESPSDLLTISRESVKHSAYEQKRQSDAKRRLLDMVNKGVEATLIQLLDTGLLHADPHPGNLRYTSAGQIGFLDFGLLCRMEKKHQYAMLASIVHIVNGDWASLVHALIEMDVVRPGTNIQRVTMEMEDALGEVEFRNGIPDVKFSRVLGKIWSVALKYHFRMPPYYTLLLRSLASLEGLAVAADPNYKTFEAAYPYVVQKLLTDNSAAMRRIFHSVVLNRRREFQWQKVALLLRVGSTRKGLQSMLSSGAQLSLDSPSNRVADVISGADLVMRLLSSKDGAVLRRFLMTADGASLVRAIVSKEANVFRQQICKIIADILYHWMYEALGNSFNISFRHPFVAASSNTQPGSSSRPTFAIDEYKSMIRDRRLKVIFFNKLESARKDPILMLRLMWTSLAMLVTASALACHRVFVSLSYAYLGHVSLGPNRVPVSA